MRFFCFISVLYLKIMLNKIEKLNQSDHDQTTEYKNGDCKKWLKKIPL